MTKRHPIQPLYSAETIRDRVRELGKRISDDYRGEDVHLLGILRGSFIFMADLCRSIERPVTLDFIALSSYGDDTKTSGVVQMELDLGINIKGRNVIIVEDIIDTGVTLSYLLKSLDLRQPKSLRICTFLSKPSRRKVDIAVDYLGFEIPDRFVVGYGLDYAQEYRALPYIGVVDPTRTIDQ